MTGLPDHSGRPIQSPVLLWTRAKGKRRHAPKIAGYKLHKGIRTMEKKMTLYRGQKTKYDKLVPALLRDGVIPRLEETIKSATNLSDLGSYKQELSECSISICPCDLLHRNLADKDHVYYFFLSLVNIGLQIRKNSVFERNLASFFDRFITYNGEDNKVTLPSSYDVKAAIEQLFAMDSIFDGNHLDSYSFFQHLNFIFPNQFPTMLLDWTSDINIAVFFSKDASNKPGTILSMEYPNELFPCLPGTILNPPSTFFNTFGYACDHYFRFNQSLMTLQKATCFYWPYNYDLNFFKTKQTKQQDALKFKIVSEEEIRSLTGSAGEAAPCDKA
jgi:hypothetical protein